MKKNRPIASLSLDLDNKWSYLKTHGDNGWTSFPSYLDIVVPRVLHFFAERRLTVTFFVVGQDAALPQNREAMQAIAASGHEIANHSFSHEPWLHLYSRSRIEEEIARTEELIDSFSGKRPVGFRGPGFSSSRTTSQLLAERHYLYEASALPTWIGPLARAYYFMSSSFEKKELEQREALFGSFKDCLRPLNPGFTDSGNGPLLQMPVTTMPLFRTPMHASYILYLAIFSKTLALSYFRTAIGLCRARGVAPSLLLHPLDFLGRDDVSDLAFFPAMSLTSARKCEIVSDLLRFYCAAFEVVPLQAHAHSVIQSHRPSFSVPIPLIPPELAQSQSDSDGASARHSDLNLHSQTLTE